MAVTKQKKFPSYFLSMYYNGNKLKLIKEMKT